MSLFNLSTSAILAAKNRMNKPGGLNPWPAIIFIVFMAALIVVCKFLK